MCRREVAKNVVRFIPEPKMHHWATGNYILNYRDPDHGFGSLAHLIMVANPRTGLPTLFYLDFGSHTMDFSYNQFSVSTIKTLTSFKSQSLHWL
jgi:hypothetical protein